uniref:NADH-ubiquinone oxidoreductase chain 5 n=1 Tax=Sphindus dubius TaxID=295944 RepID=A0A0S2MQQ2_9CUCU|nr:NADH deshydrogenase subunit 5 [Sphindus dubius]
MILNIYMYMSMISVFLFLLFLFFYDMDMSIIIEFKMITLNSCMFNYLILLDFISLLFMSFVIFISSVVLFYSLEYLVNDKNLLRFILLVFMFVISMMFMILSPNLISILLGWDGLGLVSYCLVIYYQNIKSNNAGMMTALMNRVGDVAILLSIIFMVNYGSWSFLNYLTFKNDFFMVMISILIMIAAFTKSAQIPFSAWLPMAMAAPTPVSALVHSSTLVTAGVYLLIRFNMGFSENLMNFILIISSLTMFISGLSANYEFDLKKIIAFSTLSQLGLMMSILSLGNFKLAFFHLLIHALFKALLFLCAGVVIHSLLDCQDIRGYGGLIYKMPLVSSIMILSNFSLCGIPFFSGFYSKDLIIEFASMNYLNLFIYLIYYLSIGLTVSYSMRLVYYLLLKNYSSMPFFSLSESLNKMTISLIILYLFSLISGSSVMWLFNKTPYFICLSYYMKLITIIIIIISSTMMFIMSLKNLSFIYSVNWMKYFISMIGNMSLISSFGVSRTFLVISNSFNKLDSSWLEFYGSKNMYKFMLSLLLFFQSLTKNYFKIYLILILIWLMFMF